jgi:hypothetical protein
MCTLHARSVFKNPLLVAAVGGKEGTRNREVIGESKLCLCLIKYHAMKWMCRSLALDVSKQPAFLLGRFTAAN